VPSLESLIRRNSEDWDPAVERAIFGTDESHDIAGMIEGLITEKCGPIADAVFYRPGVGVVAGVRLVEGSEVVVKVHRDNVSAERLAAVHKVQALVAECGLPAPRPLVGPTRLAGGTAIVEDLLRGTGANGRDPLVRRSLAHSLHDFVMTTAPLAGRVEVGSPNLMRPPEASLWFEPHDLRFDFEGTSPGAEWIDSLARLARRRLERPDPNVVIGHFDWRIENLSFNGAEIVGIFDWDSVASAPETFVVGVAAASFTADWTTRTEPDPLPRVSEMRSFVEDYERARSDPFDRAQREAVDAANLVACAYGARCQHSDVTRHPELISAPIPPYIRLLRERGEQALID
jgi:Phosphotransferase enzyme family